MTVFFFVHLVYLSQAPLSLCLCVSSSLFSSYKVMIATSSSSSSGTKRALGEDAEVHPTKESKADAPKQLTLHCMMELLRTPGLYFSVLCADIQQYALNFIYVMRGRVKDPASLCYDFHTKDAYTEDRFSALANATDFRCSPRGGMLVCVWPYGVLRFSQNGDSREWMKLPLGVLPVQALEMRSGAMFGVHTGTADARCENQTWFGSRWQRSHSKFSKIAVNLAETRLYRSGLFSVSISELEKTLYTLKYSVLTYDLPYTGEVASEFTIDKNPESLAVLSDDTILMSTSADDGGLVHHYSTNGQLLSAIPFDGCRTCHITVDGSDTMFCYSHALQCIRVSRPPYTTVVDVPAHNKDSDLGSNVSRLLVVDAEGTLFSVDSRGWLGRCIAKK